jgi:hypothetical protein
MRGGLARNNPGVAALISGRTVSAAAAKQNPGRKPGVLSCRLVCRVSPELVVQAGANDVVVQLDVDGRNDERRRH